MNRTADSDEKILSQTIASSATGDNGQDEQPFPPSVQGWYCVVALAMAVAVNFLDRGILTLLVEPIKQDLALSDVQMSLIMGFAFTFFYAILGLPVARMADRMSRTAIMAAGIAIWSVMTAFCGLATNFWQFFACRVGVGVGETTSGPSAYSLLSDYFPPEKLPRAIAGMTLGFVAGNGLAMVVGGAVIGLVGTDSSFYLPLIGEVHGWQMVLMVVGLPGLLVALMMLTVKEPVRRGQKLSAHESQPVSEVFRFMYHNRSFYFPIFSGLAMWSVLMFGVQMWAPAFYMRTYGWGPEQIGYVTGIGLLVSMPVGLFLGSWLAERYWKKGYHDANIRVLVYSNLVAVPLAILAPLMPSPWLAAGIFVINSVFLGMGAPVENAALQTVTPNRLRGQVTFFFLFIMNVVGMGLGPLVIAGLTQYVFLSEAGLRYSLVVSTVIMGPVGTFAFWLAMKPYGRAIAAGGLDVREVKKSGSSPN